MSGAGWKRRFCLMFGGIFSVVFVISYTMLGPVIIQGRGDPRRTLTVVDPVNCEPSVNCESCPDPCECSGRLRGVALPDRTKALQQCNLPWNNNANMPRAMTKSERETALKLLEKVDHIFTEHNMSYVMVYGTLLGSYMVHDFLPWDDDIDLFVLKKDYAKLVKGFGEQNWSSEIGIEKQCNKWAKELIKIFFHKSPQAGTTPWRWPFLDVAFYTQNETHVSSPDRKPLVMKIDEFYPLQRRPLGSLWLPAPRNTRLFLETRYKRFVCKNHWWNHREERVERKIHKVECSTLLTDYPFINRSLGVNGSSIETLILGDKALYKVHTQEPFHPAGLFDFGTPPTPLKQQQQNSNTTKKSD